MADTELQRFRCDRNTWKSGIDKAEAMRESGYDIDMSKLIRAEIDRFVGETIEQTAKRLRMTAGDEPARLYRRPSPRAAQ